MDYHEHKQVKNLEKLLPLFIDKEVYKIKDRKEGICNYQTGQIVIDCNGKLQLCCAVYDNINNFDMDYLTTPVQEIVEKKLAHDFCKKCKQYGLSF
jgi:hypothetical protein